MNVGMDATLKMVIEPSKNNPQASESRCFLIRTNGEIQEISVIPRNKVKQDSYVMIS